MNKELKKIFVVLALFSLAGGMLYNYQELWMADNNLSVKTISVVYSLCALLTVSTTFLCSNLIKQKKLKTFASGLLLVKAITLFLLFLLYKTGLNVLIKFLVMLDYVVDVEIYAAVYPMITLISKDDKIYAARSLVYSALYYIGVLLTIVLLGKSLSILNISYNFYVITSSILIFLAFAFLVFTKLEKYYPEDDSNQNNLLLKLLKELKTDKISIHYLLCVFFGQISYSSILGMIILLLTTSFGFSAQIAGTLNLSLGIIAVIVGALTLAFLTFKNDKISLGIKYGTRAFLYLMAFIFNVRWLYLVAVFYPFIISESYTHIVDAPYINRFAGKYQLAFCNFQDMIKYAGKSVGLFIGGICFNLGLRYLFAFAFVFCTLQCIFAYIALHYREKEVVEI